MLERIYTAPETSDLHGSTPHIVSMRCYGGKKTEDHKRLAFLNFLTDTTRKYTQYKIYSADGKFAVPQKAKRIMTKPGQRKLNVNKTTVKCNFVIYVNMHVHYVN